MNRREFVTLSSAALALLACSSGERSNNGPKQALRREKDARIFSRSLGEPEFLDPGLCSESEGGTVIHDCFEGLYIYGPNQATWPNGVAERHEISPDGKRYTFHLRRDAKWSDGVPLTANDFVWSWLRVLDPKTGSRYSAILWFIEGAREYNQSSDATAAGLREKVAVKALDDYTLQVDLVGPTPFFLSLTAFYTYAPVPRHVVEKHGDKWARPENIITNGPWKVTEWAQRQRITAVANPHYWDTAAVPFDKIVYRITQDQDPAYNMFLAGDTDYLDSKIPPSKLPKHRRENDPRLKVSPYMGVYYYMLNTREAPFNNVLVRRALNMAIEKVKIGKYIVKGGQDEAWSMVHPGLETVGYVKAKGDSFDPDRARELLAEAGYPEGKGFPNFKIIYNTSEGHKLVAEFIQQEWRKNLGISCDLDNMEWKVMLKKQHARDFQVSRMAWIGDYFDPLTFLDLWEGANPNNRTGWNNPEYNRLIAASMRETDVQARWGLLKQAEQIFCDELPVLPIYYYVKSDLLQPWIKGYDTHLGGVHASRWFTVKA